MPKRLQIAVLISLMVNAILSGVDLVTVLMTPGLAAHAGRLILAVFVPSSIVSAPLSWWLAPRLTAAYSRKRSR